MIPRIFRGKKLRVITDYENILAVNRLFLEIYRSGLFA